MSQSFAVKCVLHLDQKLAVFSLIKCLPNSGSHISIGKRCCGCCRLPKKAQMFHGYFFLSKTPAIILERLGGAYDVDVSSPAPRETPLYRDYSRGVCGTLLRRSGVPTNGLLKNPNTIVTNYPIRAGPHGELLTKVGNRVGCECNIHGFLLPCDAGARSIY